MSGAESAGGPRLFLIGGFDLVDANRSVGMALALQRLLAYLAIQRRPVLRTHVAGALWLDSDDGHAIGSLRSALHRIRRLCRGAVDVSSSHLSLAPDLEVDLHEAVALARRLNDPTCVVDDSAAATDVLSCDFLPDWYDDWVLVERERFRQLRVHGLESLCGRLTACARYAEAIEAGLGAVAAEPLRESAQRALILAYLAEGNTVEAIRQFTTYRAQVRDEVGCDPSPGLKRLVGR